MLKGLFHSSASQAGAPAAEVRRVPTYIQGTNGELITTQVFVDKKNKKHRIYYAAESADGATWKIYQYHYPLSSSAIERWHSNYAHVEDYERMTIEVALKSLAKLEKEMQEDGYAPVSGLKGNYREAAILRGAYFDDQGNYVSVAKDKPLAKDAAFSRKSISAIYANAAGKSNAPFIKEWHHFSFFIVRRFGRADETDYLAQIISSPDYEWYVRCSLEMLKANSEFEQIIGNPRLPLYKKQDTLKRVASAGVRAADHPQLEYHYYAAQLVSLMRAGALVYKQCLTQVDKAEENFQLLSEIRDSITAAVQNNSNLRHWKEQAKEIASLIAREPGPYADKTLPLEEILAKYAPPQKPNLKTPGL